MSGRLRSVGNTPGAMPFTRMPMLPHSFASPRIEAEHAALAAGVGEHFAEGDEAVERGDEDDGAALALVRRATGPSSRVPASRQTMKLPVRLTRTIRSNSSVATSSDGLR